MNLYPFFPEKMSEMLQKIGLQDYKEQLEVGKFEQLRKKKETFFIKEKGQNLFERFEVE
jgi:methionyl-tRNA synthetase